MTGTSGIRNKTLGKRKEKKAVIAVKPRLRVLEKIPDDNLDPTKHYQTVLEFYRYLFQDKFSVVQSDYHAN